MGYLLKYVSAVENLYLFTFPEWEIMTKIRQDVRLDEGNSDPTPFQL